MSTAKSFLIPLFERAKNVTDILTLKRSRAQNWQDQTLKKMMFKARNTVYGKQYHFEDLLIHHNPVESFRNSVPITNYELMHPWWDREYNGEDNVTWPGTTTYFALSSGTTQGSSKYIPVTRDQLKAISRAVRRQLFAIAKTDVPKDFFTKHYLLVGGSTDLNFDGQKYSGDLSGITTSNLPFWFDFFSRPTNEIKRERDWHQKMEIMVNEAPNWDISMVAGGPAWIKLLFEKIIERYNLNNIHEIWPHLSVFVWGAVALTPYKKQIDAMLGKPIYYFENYLASEGFIASQNKLNTTGMSLVFRNNTYYEFVPFTEENFVDGNILPNAKALDISEVEEGVEYAILITTSAGAWRYMIGDVVLFTNLEACEIKIIGRTRQFLSLCGEHLSVDNMNQGVERTSEELGFSIPEYSVRGMKFDDNNLGHRWFVAIPEGVEMPDKDLVRSILDRQLCSLNDDYEIERKHVLKTMKIHLLPERDFLDFLDSKGKLGGQAKFPRVMAESVYEEWISFLLDRYQNDTFA